MEENNNILYSSYDVTNQYENSFQLIWYKLSFYRKVSKFKVWKKEEKVDQILKSISGYVTSGTINAILGPSGSGKTTFLNCLTGRIKGKIFGETFVRSSNDIESNLKNRRIAYVPQIDSLLTRFTVKETVMFSSKLNNCNFSSEKHLLNLKLILTSLDLHDQLDSPLTKLSGGQLKRVSIAVELVSNPAVIVLDEPTSGLDSDTAENLIKMLKCISRSDSSGLKPIVLMTIHSPSYEVFTSFDQVYLLSRNGFNIYQGPPCEVMSFFNSFDFKIKGNPAESILEIANGKFGEDKFNLMSLKCDNYMNKQREEKDISISSINNYSSLSLSKQTWILIKRTLAYDFFKLPQALGRSIMHGLVFAMLMIVFREPVAEDPLCWNELGQIDNLNRKNWTANENLNQIKFKFEFMRKADTMLTMSSFALNFIINYTFITCITAMLLIWLRQTVHYREVCNSWYSPNAFFLSKLIADSISRLISLLLGTIVIFYLSGSSVDYWRLIIFLSILFVVISFWENVATIVAILKNINQNNLLPTMGSFLIIHILDIVCIDFVVFERNFNSEVKFLKKISPLNAAWVTMLVSLFGFNRCSSDPLKIIKSYDLSAYSSPIEMINRIWYILKFTEKDMVRQFATLDLDEDDASKFYHSMVQWIGPEIDFSSRQPSYMLFLFDYNDNLTLHVISCCTWLTLSVLLMWFVTIRGCKMAKI